MPPISYKYRGLAVIIVNTFKGERRGAEKDYKGMLDLFTALDFHVKAYEFKDLELDDLKTKLNNLKNKIDDPECFVCVVSSHGKEKDDRKSGTYSPEFYTAEGHLSYPVSKLVQHFSDWEAYAGKPKLFFIQTCRTKDKLDVENEMYDNGKTLPVIIEHNSADLKDDTSFNSAGGRDKPDCSAQAGTSSEQESDKGGNTAGRGDNIPGVRSTGRGDNIPGMGPTGKEDNPPNAGSNGRKDKSDSDGQPLPSTSKKAAAGGSDMPDEPRDTSLIECPRDCLIMFPVVFGRAALRDDREEDNTGSWMLRFMSEQQNKLIADGRLLPFLTSVADKIARRDFAPDGHPTTTKCAAFITHRLTTEVIFEPMADTCNSPMAKKRAELQSS